MFTVDALNRIKISKGDNATFNIEVYNEDGTPYKMETGDSLTMTVKDLSTGTTAISLTADSENYFIFLPSTTSSLTKNFFSYDIKLTTRDSQVYTLVDNGYFEVLE